MYIQSAQLTTLTSSPNSSSSSPLSRLNCVEEDSARPTYLITFSPVHTVSYTHCACLVHLLWHRTLIHRYGTQGIKERKGERRSPQGLTRSHQSKRPREHWPEKPYQYVTVTVTGILSARGRNRQLGQKHQRTHTYVHTGAYIYAHAHKCKDLTTYRVIGQCITRGSNLYPRKFILYTHVL